MNPIGVLEDPDKKLSEYYERYLLKPIQVVSLGYSDNKVIASYNVVEVSGISFIIIDNGKVTIDPSLVDWKDYIPAIAGGYIQTRSSIWIRSQPFYMEIKISDQRGNIKNVNFYGNLQICLNSQLNLTLWSKQYLSEGIESVCLYTEDFVLDLQRNWIPITNENICRTGILTKSVSNR